MWDEELGLVALLFAVTTVAPELVVVLFLRELASSFSH